MSRLTRDGTAEPVSRDQILRHARGQGNVHFPCSADHEQDWQPYPVDPYSAICDDHSYIHTYIHQERDWPPNVDASFFFFSERAAHGGGGGGGGRCQTLFFFPVQQTTSGIGHRVK